MYNENLKNRFLAGYGNSGKTKVVARNILQAFEKYEEEWGADLCTRTVNELRPAVDATSRLRMSSQLFQLQVLKDYSRWCAAMKIPGARDAMSQIQVAGIDTVREQMVSGPAHLQRYLDALFDDVTKQTIDIVYRSYLWLAFCGISEEDALKIRTQDVDLLTMTINLPNGESYPIYREACFTIHLAASLSDFAYFHPKYVGARRKRVEGDLILRGIKSNASASAMRSKISERASEAYSNGAITQRISYSRAFLSGVFYRMYEDEQAGCEVDFLEFAKKESPTLAKSRLSSKACLYKQDYLRWKLAFKY